MNASSETTEDAVQAPPSKLLATLSRLGPGMIIAGSIVGSGELIATTKVGAEAGFSLLWLILLGCLIKVFVQVEFGRHTVAHGQTPLDAMNGVAGPRWKVNWIIWGWALMTVTVILQQGGIVAGVGQALAISVPLTDRGREMNAVQSRLIESRVALAQAYQRNSGLQTSDWRDLEKAWTAVVAAKAKSQQEGLAEADDRLASLRAARHGKFPAEEAAQLDELDTAVLESMLAVQASRMKNDGASDATYWAGIIAVGTSFLLWFGRYGFIQGFSTVLVGAFTLVTLVAVGGLQATDWSIGAGNLAQGFSFGLPEKVAGTKPLATALAAFGIIGVGAAELIMYPYWCLEKGYARHAGRPDGSQAWLQRAQGWMRVMRLDAWGSMVIYTFATLAFYLLGAAILWRVGLNPTGDDMVRTLSQMYRPVFGSWAPGVFLVGAIAVLYSTFFVAAAGNARMVADGLGLYGCHSGTEDVRMVWTRRISALWPLVAFVLYLFFKAPAEMVLFSGAAQALMLPALGVAALDFRYRRSREGLRPGRLWDIGLWVSVAGFVVAGGWAAYETLHKYLGN